MKIVIMIIYSMNVNATQITECGDYQIEGFVRKQNSNAVIIINEKTLSEIKLSSPFNWEAKLHAYMNQPIDAKIKIIKKMNAQSGSLHSIQAIDLRIPDPAKYHPEKIKLIKKGVCQ